jgi:hypothetical protein
MAVQKLLAEHTQTILIDCDVVEAQEFGGGEFGPDGFCAHAGIVDGISLALDDGDGDGRTAGCDFSALGCRHGAGLGGRWEFCVTLLAIITEGLVFTDDESSPLFWWG